MDLQHHLPEEEEDSSSDPLLSPPSTTFASPSDLCPDLDSLLDLACRGQWRTLLDRATTASQSPAHLLLLLPHHRLVLLSFSVLALFKLRRFSDASLSLLSLLDGHDSYASDADPFDFPRFRYESFPEAYPGRRGSMVPFTLRYLHAALPGRLGDRSASLDRLYLLLHLVRRRLPNDASPSPPLSLWPRREAFVLSTLIANHFVYRELDVCLALIGTLIARNPSDPILLSRLAYVQLQIGNLDGARAAFARAEEAAAAQSGAGGVEMENLVARNRALALIAAKDYAAAVREYEGCVERDPSDVVAVSNKALCLLYSRDLSDSIKMLEGALERVPTAALNETLVVNLCSMYELAYVNHGEVKKSLSDWIARVAPDDFDPSCTRA